MIVFSQRHKESLANKRLELTISKKIRQKLIFAMQKYNKYSGWNDEYSLFHDDLKQKLLETLGETSLKAYVDDIFQEISHIEDFIRGTKPEYVLDAIELFITLIEKPGEKTNFYKEINSIFKSENSFFRMLDSQIIKLDSAFLESEVLNKAHELLSNNHFDKACKDFLNARNNFTAGDSSGTITEANNAIESTLKKVLNKEKIQQGDLKKSLIKSGIIPDYFQGFCDHFEGLLQSAFTIANESARHGKKEIPEKKNEVDQAIASFFLHLSGSLIVFVMERYQESLPEEEIPF